MSSRETDALPAGACAIRPGLSVVAMGVSGCGKSSIGLGLSARSGLAFIEGDRLHPKANVEKMAAGIALTDEDRWPWLDKIGAEIAAAHADGKAIIVACSALKRSYRDRLRAAASGALAFVYLEGSVELLKRRMGARTGHFMPVSLLESQLKTLEVPTGEPNVVTVAIDASIDEIVARACEGLTRL
ncbi:gluconokinase [Xaviernesmea oryzae]|uniref:gluconokinase n=1 Tax=Xaviernesmea oryzae TaxID=464029 RepID=UPI0008AB5D0D|nr:gluconokinase [Xaviernesmea oryzae]SEL34332.1 gluconate kinase, SKI family [Xaviernesmea oryzae]